MAGLSDAELQECVNHAIRTAIVNKIHGFKGQWTFKKPDDDLGFSDYAVWRAFLGDIVVRSAGCAENWEVRDPEIFDEFQSKQLWQLKNKIIDTIKGQAGGVE